MKKMILLSFLVLFIPVILYGQDKIEAPVWNIGDRWSFAGHFPMSVINTDENSYTVKVLARSGESIYIYDKSSLNILYSVEGDRRIEFKGVHKRRLIFPFEIGKSWKDSSMSGVSSYEVQVATDSAFTNIVASTAGLTGIQWAVTPGLSVRTTYFWRARAANPCGPGPWSMSWSFKTM